MSQVFRREGDRQGGDSARIDHQEKRPAEEKRDHRSVRFAKEDVSAASLGHGRAQFAERQGAEKAQDAADHPDGEDEKRDLDGHGHVLRDEKDARADDAADDDADDIPKSQNPRKAFPLFFDGVHAPQLIGFRRFFPEVSAVGYSAKPS